MAGAGEQKKRVMGPNFKEVARDELPEMSSS